MAKATDKGVAKRSTKPQKPSAATRVLDKLAKAGRRKPGRRTMEFIPTGLHNLDEAIGGGLVRGRMYEVAGNESVGKTTLAVEIAKAFQAAGRCVVYNDYEHTFDINYAKAMGLTVEEPLFILDQPVVLEDGMAVAKDLIESGAVGLVVTDSVAAMAAQKEVDGKQIPAMQASALGGALRSYIGLLSETGTVGLFINHIRCTFEQFGPSITTPGGKALKYFSSSRMFMSARKSKVNEDNGIRAKISIWKNKQSANQRAKVEYEILPMVGIVRAEELLDIGKAKGLITERLKRFTIQDKTFAGRANILEVLGDERVKKWVLDTPPAGTQEG